MLQAKQLKQRQQAAGVATRRASDFAEQRLQRLQISPEELEEKLADLTPYTDVVLSALGIPQPQQLSAASQGGPGQGRRAGLQQAQAWGSGSEGDWEGDAVEEEEEEEGGSSARVGAMGGLATGGRGRSAKKGAVRDLLDAHTEVRGCNVHSAIPGTSALAAAMHACSEQPLIDKVEFACKPARC